MSDERQDGAPDSADGGHAQDTEQKDSNPNAAGPERAAGGMGVSSERVGATGHGHESTDGERDTRQAGTSGDPGLSEEDAPPEQSTGGAEQNPEGLPPAAGYPSHDPRSDHTPYKDA